MKPTLLAVLVLSLLTVATPRVTTQTLLAQSIANGKSSCRSGDRGRPLDVERVASHPTAASVRDYFDEWVAFYQDFYQFPEIPVTFTYGFDSYKITYCTVDAILPGQSMARAVSATGMLSVPRKPGPLSTVAYLHGTSVSFYDAVSNPNIFGEFSPNGESFDGPPSNAIFAGAGFIYVGPDYLGLGDSTGAPASILPRGNRGVVCDRPAGGIPQSARRPSRASRTARCSRLASHREVIRRSHCIASCSGRAST